MRLEQPFPRVVCDMGWKLGLKGEMVGVAWKKDR